MIHKRFTAGYDHIRIIAYGFEFLLQSVYQNAAVIHFDPLFGIGAVHGKVGIATVTDLTIHFIYGTKSGTGEIAPSCSQEERGYTRIFSFSLNREKLFGQVEHQPPVS